MKLAMLFLRPRAFFEEQADSLGWAWPLVGFYLFAFATYFQAYVVPGYHMPFWLVLYIVAWVPALMVASGLFVVLVLLWYWPATRVLGGVQSFERSTKTVGVALLPPATLLCAALLVLAILNSNDFAVPYRKVVRAVHSLAGVWALALIVLGAMVCNKFTARKTALFALWLALPIVLLAVIVYVIAIRG